MAADYDTILDMLVANLGKPASERTYHDNDNNGFVMRIDCGTEPEQFSTLFDAELARVERGLSSAKLSLTLSKLSSDGQKLLGFCHFVDEAPFSRQLIEKFAKNAHINIPDVVATLKELITHGIIRENADASLSLIPDYTHKLAAHHVQQSEKLSTYIMVMSTIFDGITTDEGSFGPNQKALLFRALRFIQIVSADLPLCRAKGEDFIAMIVLTNNVCKWATLASTYGYCTDAKTLFEFATQLSGIPEYRRFLSEDVLINIETGLEQATIKSMDSDDTIASVRSNSFCVPSSDMPGRLTP